jgi:hypothetical protein
MPYIYVSGSTHYHRKTKHTSIVFILTTTTTATFIIILPIQNKQAMETQPTPSIAQLTGGNYVSNNNGGDWSVFHAGSEPFDFHTLISPSTDYNNNPNFHNIPNIQTVSAHRDNGQQWFPSNGVSFSSPMFDGFEEVLELGVTNAESGVTSHTEAHNPLSYTYQKSYEKPTIANNFDNACNQVNTTFDTTVLNNRTSNNTASEPPEAVLFPERNRLCSDDLVTPKVEVRFLLPDLLQFLQYVQHIQL